MELPSALTCRLLAEGLSTAAHSARSLDGCHLLAIGARSREGGNEPRGFVGNHKGLFRVIPSFDPETPPPMNKLGSIYPGSHEAPQNRPFQRNLLLVSHGPQKGVPC